MKTDLLNIKYETIANLNTIMGEIFEKYPLLKNEFHCDFESESINIKLLSKAITIPYYKKITGNIVNSEQMQANIDLCIEPIYDSIEYKNLNADEIRDKIMEKFIVEDKVQNN